MTRSDEEPTDLFGLDDLNLDLLGAGSGQDLTNRSQPGQIPTSYPLHDASQTFFSPETTQGWDPQSGSTAAGSFDFLTDMASDDVLKSFWQNQDMHSNPSLPQHVTPQPQSTSRPNLDPAMLRQAPWPPNDSSVKQPQHFAANGLSNSAYNLSPNQQRMLVNVAMAPHIGSNSTGSVSTGSPVRFGDAGSSLSPDGLDSNGRSGSSKKRKASEDVEDDEEEDEDGRPIKKTAHNEIERRYRNNINDKINELRDSVPSLRIMYKSSRGEDTTEDREELCGLTPAHKLNKGTVLSKAVEYIHHLKKRNSRLADENNAMRARLAAFEKLYMAGAMNGSVALPGQHQSRPASSSDGAGQHIASSPTSRSSQQHQQQHQQQHGAPAGLIQVPDDMRRIISASTAYGQPYPVPHQPYQSAATPTYQLQRRSQQSHQQNGHSFPRIGRLMVGSLAGVMLLQSTREKEKSNETPEGRGLMALPLDLLHTMASSMDFVFMGYHVHTSLKIILLLGILISIWAPSLLTYSPPRPKKVAVSDLQAAPSLASSIQVRRSAWLTAVQTVWVPRHNFVLEALALLLKIVKITVRNAMGVRGFQLLTGLTEEQEAARVKAWIIALDSQLAGGDIEVNKSRLILTLLASYTLPESPMRLMLRALHFRVLFWNVAPEYTFNASNAIAAKVARSLWNEARQLNQVLTQLKDKTSVEQENELPAHLAALVERDCDAVLSPNVIQRAYNLAFNLDTTNNVEVPLDGMDAVVEDPAIGSPMDAVGAWCSTELLHHHVLMGSLNRTERELRSRAANVALAMKVAPVGSVAQNRALVAQAVLVSQSRGANIAAALQAINPKEDQNLPPNSMQSTHPAASIRNPDLAYCMRCAVALAHLQRSKDKSALPYKVQQLIASTTSPRDIRNLSLLGFTAAMELLEGIFEDARSVEVFSGSMEKLAGGLRLWIGGATGDDSGVEPYVRLRVVNRCLGIAKYLVGVDMDQGYASLSEADGVEA